MTSGFKMFVDAEGVPYSEYGQYRGIDIGRQRSILAVAERGLWYWNNYLAEPPDRTVLLSYDWLRFPINKNFTPAGVGEARAMLLRCAEWLLHQLQQREGYSVWAYSYPISYGAKPGWRSAHAQAVGLQLLARAEEISEGGGYLAPMDELLAAFSVDVRDGGLSTIEGGHIWFEKIADSEIEQPKILNGMLFSVLGLLDVAKRTGDRNARALADEGLATAVDCLPRFDLGDWSAHDIFGRRASPHYHDIHIAQCGQLFSLTGDDRFLWWRDRFQSQRSR